MKIKLIALCALLFVVAFVLPLTLVAQESDVVARDAWVRMPAPSKMDTALYFVVENHSSEPKTVVSASSDSAAKLEMHEMKTVKKDDSAQKQMGRSDSSSAMSMDKPTSQPMMTMTPISKIEIPANGKVTLAPNGLHIMMFGLKSRPVMGDKINITLKLDDGTTVPAVATVK
jgi:periplasmic copper chaperone A